MVLLAVAIEALTVLALILTVAAVGPSEPAEAQAFAERIGLWLGPTAGSILCVGGGWLVARKLTEGHVLRGLILGTMVAAIDIAILVASGAAFRPLLVVSNLGRVLSGSLGGAVAARTYSPGKHADPA
jgi:hypothetical protein